MEKFTLKQMEELLAVHEAAEFELDLDATMATLVDNPVYELPTLGWHIQGREAVTETYLRMLPAAGKLNIYADKRVHAVDDSTLCREAYVYWDTPDGGRETGQYMTTIAFRNNLIYGERMYMCDRYTQVMAEILGPDFGQIPGVSRLADEVPPARQIPDRAKEHAANPDH